MASWKPWHGCHKCSPGCLNCYVYRGDARYGRDASSVYRTKEFDLPARGRRDGSPALAPGETVFTCLTSDFFVPDADEWRVRAWRMIRARPDLMFFIITKRIERFCISLPEDWGEGYGNVTIAATCENRVKAQERLPLLLSHPIRHRQIVCEPLLEEIDLAPWLPRAIEGVIVGGESGEAARLCRYAWVTRIADQCRRAGVPFTFKQTGAHFEKDGRVYRVPRREQHAQAYRAGISTRLLRVEYDRKQELFDDITDLEEQ